jgi:hypothetical protein
MSSPRFKFLRESRGLHPRVSGATSYFVRRVRRLIHHLGRLLARLRSTGNSKIGNRSYCRLDVQHGQGWSRLQLSGVFVLASDTRDTGMVRRGAMPRRSPLIPIQMRVYFLHQPSAVLPHLASRSFVCGAVKLLRSQIPVSIAVLVRRSLSRIEGAGLI